MNIKDQVVSIKVCVSSEGRIGKRGQEWRAGRTLEFRVTVKRKFNT